MLKTTLEQWRMFKAVVDTGGFNQAAEKVHKSQSSIHHAVGKLEQALGVKLFDIQGRKTVLTEAGKLMLRRGQYLLDEAARIEAVANALSEGVESHLRIAVDGAFIQSIVFQALETVSQRYPQTNMDIIDTVLSGTNELLSKGEADLGLSPFVLSDSLSEEICLIDFVAAAHIDHPLHQLDRPIDYEDLKAHRQIIVRDSANDSKISVGWFGAEQRWTVDSMRASIDLITQGMGFAWLPVPLICGALKAQVLKPLPLKEGAKRTASFYLNFVDKDKLGPVAREFIGQLRLLTLDMPTSDDI